MAIQVREDHLGKKVFKVFLVFEDLQGKLPVKMDKKLCQDLLENQVFKVFPESKVQLVHQDLVVTKENHVAHVLLVHVEKGDCEDKVVLMELKVNVESKD